MCMFIWETSKEEVDDVGESVNSFSPGQNKWSQNFGNSGEKKNYMKSLTGLVKNWKSFSKASYQQWGKDKENFWIFQILSYPI